MLKDLLKKILLVTVFFSASQLNAHEAVVQPLVVQDEEIDEQVAKVVEIMTAAKEAGLSDEQILKVAAQHTNNIKAFQRSNNRKHLVVFVAGIAAGIAVTTLVYWLYKWNKNRKPVPPPADKEKEKEPVVEPADTPPAALVVEPPSGPAGESVVDPAEEPVAEPVAEPPVDRPPVIKVGNCDYRVVERDGELYYDGEGQRYHSKKIGKTVRDRFGL